MARLTVWARLKPEPGLRVPPSRCPGWAPWPPGHCSPQTVGPPASPSPMLLTQHVHGVQPGVLPGRVVGHAGVGARVRGLQALQHQGAAVLVEPGAGREGQRAPLPGVRAGAGAGHRPGLTGGGGPRPGPAGHHPLARSPPVVAAHRPRSPAAPPAPPGRCAPAWHLSSGFGGPLWQGLQ